MRFCYNSFVIGVNTSHYIVHSLINIQKKWIITQLQKFKLSCIFNHPQMGIFNKICIVLKFHSKSATNVRNMNNMILIMVFHIRIETNSLVPTRKRNQLQKEKKNHKRMEIYSLFSLRLLWKLFLKPNHFFNGSWMWKWNDLNKWIWDAYLEFLLLSIFHIMTC